MNAPKEDPPADAALDALAAALLPRLARLLREDAGKDDDRAALVEMLALAGYEIDDEGEPLLAAKPLSKAPRRMLNDETSERPRPRAAGSGGRS